MTGRPKKGTGGHTVRVSASNASSHRLLLGKELWRGIGAPKRVSVARHGNVLTIAATTEEGAGTYAVSSGALSQPRISIGKEICRAELRIFVPVRYEQVQLRQHEIVVFV